MSAAPFKRGDHVQHVRGGAAGRVVDVYAFALPPRSVRDWQIVVSWDDSGDFSHAADMLRAVPS